MKPAMSDTFKQIRRNKEALKAFQKAMKELHSGKEISYFVFEGREYFIRFMVRNDE